LVRLKHRPKQPGRTGSSGSTLQPSLPRISHVLWHDLWPSLTQMACRPMQYCSWCHRVTRHGQTGKLLDRQYMRSALRDTGNENGKRKMGRRACSISL